MECSFKVLKPRKSNASSLYVICLRRLVISTKEQAIRRVKEIIKQKLKRVKPAKIKLNFNASLYNENKQTKTTLFFKNNFTKEEFQSWSGRQSPALNKT